MEVTLTNTDRIVEINGVPARVWEGRTTSGIPCHAYITRIAVARDQDAHEFDRELQETAPEEQQAGITKAIELAKATAGGPEEEPIQKRPLALVNLTLDARALLVETPNPTQRKIERVLDECDSRRVESGGQVQVTPDNYAALSKALRWVPR